MEVPAFSAFFSMMAFSRDVHLNFTSSFFFIKILFFLCDQREQSKRFLGSHIDALRLNLWTQRHLLKLSMMLIYGFGRLFEKKMYLWAKKQVGRYRFLVRPSSFNRKLILRSRAAFLMRLFKTIKKPA
jgi:hypothetical protein